MAGFGRNPLQLLPQLHNQLIESPGGPVIFDAPDLVEKRFPGDGVAALPVENRQHLQLARGELKPLCAALTAEGSQIDPDLAKSDFVRDLRRAWARFGPAEEGLN